MKLIKLNLNHIMFLRQARFLIFRVIRLLRERQVID